ncbi:MAG: nuclear transport factor 2 family protein [Phenylobacterium sp.]|uniref:nuclear transport factor 2 family protein n=1 Tax=Phenylobacterium sp. TaxID=1871053 RepID=UPI001A29EC1F|nr:nuclear transport factor 2 family protein [Phenylobacterium sp.]MBJ7410362.1 nuclear transport factor 2 family protein [Phenylobacterium sp.]
MDIADFNARWLAAWTAKDVDALCAFYAEDCVYRDPQTAGGLTGNAALRAYLTGLFAATPSMTYTPDETWPIPGGFCGRWYCEIGPGGSGGRLRGFDLVILDGDRIALNEVYVHQMPA